MSTARQPRSQSRSVARLAAVQALFQLDVEETSTAKLLKEFHDHRLGEILDDVEYAEAEIDFFDDIVLGVGAEREALDALITERLADGWTLARLDPTMLQILRAGSWELGHRPDVPTATVINEYIDVADAFFDEREKGFANGLLDAIARQLRPGGSN